MPTTAATRRKAGWPTLVGGYGSAFVLGLPSGFDLTETLRKAESIRLATAFAHYAGWEHLKHGISDRNAFVYLLTGSEFFQTEPRLLRAWLELVNAKADRIKARLAPNDPFFHPKVLIVTSNGEQPDFAVVGSGNLSHGGLQTNSECSVYVQDAEFVKQLISWFDRQFDSSVPLSSKAIAKYEKSYKQNRRRRDALQRVQRNVAEQLTEAGRAEMQRWDDAVDAAVKYFGSAKFSEAYDVRREGANQILVALGSPRFQFDRRGFDEFFGIGPLGHLDARNKNGIFKNANRVRNGLRLLITEGERALPQMLNREGRFYVRGVRLNFVSKILAAYDPKSWPVFNNKVDAALRDFQYRPPRGEGTAGKYLAYRDLMKKFIAACKAKGSKGIDAFALDAFFYDRARDIERRKERRA